MITISETRIHQFGTMGMVGGILLLVYTIPDLIAPETFSGSGRIATFYGLFNLVILGLLLAGLIGLHGRIREKTGRVERIGYYMSLIGFGVGMLSLVHLYGIGSENDASFITFILGIFTFVIGSALIGLASWRAEVLPRGGAALFILAPVGIPLVFVLAETAIGTPFVAIAAPYGAAWAVVGHHLRSVE